MRNFSLILLISVILGSGFSASAHDRIFLIPGIKFTKTFGQGGKNVLGFDVSLVYTNRNDDTIWGINSTFDFMAEDPKISLGAEYISPDIAYVGISAGPVFHLTRKQFGLYSVVFAATPVIPAFQYSLFFDAPDVSEFGMFIKLPIKVGGEKSGYFNYDFSGMNLF